jgi:hypothetical protein
MAQIQYCEQTEKDVTSNYRGELIGSVIATFVLRALTELVGIKSAHTYEIFCDNMGVVRHGNNVYRPLSESQAQADLLTLLRRNILVSELKVTYVHVYGHLDDNTSFSELSLPQQLNVMADKLARDHLLAQVALGTAWGPTYPHEPVRIWLSQKKITSSFRQAIYTDWGAQVAMRLFARRRIVH